MMSAAELARLLNSGADGIDVVRLALPPAVCDGLVELLSRLKGGRMANGDQMALETLGSTWGDSIDKIIGILTNLKNANNNGDMVRMSATMRRFSERRVMLGIVGRLIR